MLHDMFLYTAIGTRIQGNFSSCSTQQGMAHNAEDSDPTSSHTAGCLLSFLQPCNDVTES